MASLSVGIAAIVVTATGFIPLLPYCDLHLWPRLPSHMLQDWELVRLYAFYVLNAPLQWPKPAKWLLSTAPMLRWFRLVSARRERGGGWVGQTTELWLDWLTLWKGQLEGMRGEELPKWPFSLPLLPLARAETLYGYLWACGRARGAAVKPTSPLCCEGWAKVPVIGSVLSYIHARTHKCSHTIKNSSQSCKDRREDSVARQIWKMRCAAHNSCQQFDRCLSSI